MKTRTLIFALAAAFSTAATLPALAAESHHHGHGSHAGTPQKLTLNNGRKWSTDAPLRKGMQEIRDALEGAHGHGHHGAASPAKLVDLGKKMESEIAGIVMNCRLEPAADANLHVIIGELNAAADAFRGASPAGAEEAMHRATRAVGDYERYFDHPGFSKKVSQARPLDLQGAVDLVASTYPGRIVAAQADLTGGEGLHFHVDTLLPHGRIARFDVDADTHRIFNRLPAEVAPEGALSLNDAVKKVQQEIRGDVVAAEFDPDPRPHYHLSVRLPGGHFTRLDLDLATGKAVKHTPRM
jgi:hypothetical protein